MSRETIVTDNAPSAIGTYSQAVKTGRGAWFSFPGQIPLVPHADPAQMALVSDDFIEQAHQVFKNLIAVAEAAGGGLADCVKLNIYLTDLGKFATVNSVMAEYVPQPYPARSGRSFRTTQGCANRN